jgi:hypothetical protein
MKKILLFLLLIVSFAATAQKTYSVEKPLQLNTVNVGSISDSVLVRGVDKIVKFIPRSEFGKVDSLGLQEVLNIGNIARIENNSANILGISKGNRVVEFSLQNGNNQTFFGLTAGGMGLSNNFSSGTKNSHLAFTDSKDASVQLSLFDSTINGNTVLSFNDITQMGNSKIRIPQKLGDHTLAMLDDFKTINGQSIVGNGNIALATTSDFKTINGQSLVGTGDIVISGGGTVNGGLKTLTGDSLTTNLQFISDNTNVSSPLRISTKTITSTGTTNAANTNNTAFGVGALVSNISGIRNTMFGFYAGQAFTTAEYNTGFGNGALSFATTGNNNTALGTQTLNTLNGGNANVAVGEVAGYDVTTGNYNIFIGSYAGRKFGTGNYNLVIGSSSSPLLSGSNYNVIIGMVPIANAAVLQNNVIIADGQGNKRIQIDAVGKTNILGNLNITNTPVYADNSAAITGGLLVGDVYRTAPGVLMIRY